MSDETNPKPSLKARAKETAREALGHLDKALDAGVQSALITIFSTPPEMPVDWRSMLRIGSKFIKETAKETASVLFSKEEKK